MRPTLGGFAKSAPAPRHSPILLAIFMAGAATEVIPQNGCSEQPDEGTDSPLIKHKNRFVLVCVAALTILASTAGNARADYLSGDPRQCTQAPAGTHHAYNCAKLSAVAVTRNAMARNQHVTRWFSPVYCDTVSGNMLRWKCDVIYGGDTWKVIVWFRATSSGWKRVVTVTMNP